MEALAMRARRHQALGDVNRLAIVDELRRGDASSTQLRRELGLESNLIAHHLQVLHDAGLIRRVRSQGDRRRSYLTLVEQVLAELVPPMADRAARVVFVCTENAARSQLASAIWRDASAVPSASAGTHPAPRVHPGTLDAARRHHLDLADAQPRALDDVLRDDDIVITVCDRAHEELGQHLPHRHWSVRDPAADGSPEAFDETVSDLRHRAARLATTVVA